jgi:hypothetical protein
LEGFTVDRFIVDIRTWTQPVADIRTMICVRKSWRRALVETCPILNCAIATLCVF